MIFIAKAARADELAECSFKMPRYADVLILSERDRPEDGVWLVGIEKRNSGRFSIPNSNDTYFRPEVLEDYRQYVPITWLVNTRDTPLSKTSGHTLERLFNFRIRGIIGYDLLFDKVLVISPDKEIFAVCRDIPQIDNELQSIHTIHPSAGNLNLSLRLDDVTFNFRLCTQTNADLIMQPSELNRISRARRQLDTTTVVETTDGFKNPQQMTNGKILSVDSIQFENTILKDIQIAIESDVPRGNSIGLGFLKRFLSVIDLKNNELRLYERKSAWERWQDTALVPIGRANAKGFELVVRPMKGYLNDLLEINDVIVSIDGCEVAKIRHEEIGVRLSQTWLQGGVVEIIRKDKQFELDVISTPHPSGFFGNP
jgi:hypothetical protein